MGKELEKAAIEQNHEIVHVINSSNAGELNKLRLAQADVAIEFSTPGTVVQNIYKCFESRIPVIVGTTGW
jgi:4-hydroxy-tetrahydrodipicolinate reductase